MYVFLDMSVSSSIMQLDHTPVEMGNKAPNYLNVTVVSLNNSSKKNGSQRSTLVMIATGVYLNPYHRAYKIKGQTFHDVRKQQKYVILKK